MSEEEAHCGVGANVMTDLQPGLKLTAVRTTEPCFPLSATQTAKHSAFLRLKRLPYTAVAQLKRNLDLNTHSQSCIVKEKWKVGYRLCHFKKQAAEQRRRIAPPTRAITNNDYMDAYY